MKPENETPKRGSKSMPPSEFLAKAKEVHGDIYDYSNTKYKSSNIKIEIECRDHGIFKQSPGAHLKGQGCRNCFFEQKKTWSREDEKFLIDNYGKMVSTQIAKELGKTWRSISNKAFSLGLKTDRSSNRGTHDVIPATILTSLMYRATRNHGQESIDFDDNYLWSLYEKQKRKCALTGWDILFTKEKGKNTASVDRIDSKKGYSIDNIQIIHKNINAMKLHFPDEYFYRACEAITRNRTDLKQVKVVYEDDHWLDIERIVVLQAKGETGFEDMPDNCYEKY